jgi:hypothetical protein
MMKFGLTSAGSATAGDKDDEIGLSLQKVMKE